MDTTTYRKTTQNLLLDTYLIWQRTYTTRSFQERFQNNRVHPEVQNILSASSLSAFNLRQLMWPAVRHLQNFTRCPICSMPDKTLIYHCMPPETKSDSQHPLVSSRETNIISIAYTSNFMNKPAVIFNALPCAVSLRWSRVKQEFTDLTWNLAPTYYIW